MNEPRINAGLKALIWISCILVFVIALAGLVLYSLFSLGGASHVEVARAESPDGAIDAVLVETNGGATTSFGYRVHVVPTGSAVVEPEAAFLYGATRSNCAYGVNLRWTGPNRLLVEYQQAQQAKATDANVGERSIEVDLAAGVINPQAPCGGMEYNLRGRPYG